MTADVGVFVEGTYPYLRGGVSSWLHSLMTHLPELSFDVVHLEAVPGGDRELRYVLPDNLAGLHHVAMHDSGWTKGPRSLRRPSDLWRQLSDFHADLAAGREVDPFPLLRRLGVPGSAELSARDLLYASESWDLLVELYRARARRTSFLDFFWTFRSTHIPLFTLLQASFPPARLYHTLSTGYAGFMAAVMKMRTSSPLLLTEHGVYNREREIEIAQSQWIYSAPSMGQMIPKRLGFFKEWWIGMFRFMAWLTYLSSDRVLSIASVNQPYQLAGGADPGRMAVIPNGIDVDSFGKLQGRERREGDDFVVGFVGRVVPIKDVKTLILAVKIASNAIPGLKAIVVGPTDEDSQYFAECAELAELLGVSPLIRFTGAADVREFYPQMDVMVLTSLSEGQPLVIMEANCAGVPAVSTDVGACAELLLGATAEDRAIGPAGIITPIASPQDTARALVQLWQDEDMRRRMGRAGRTRVLRFYREESVYEAYRRQYRDLLPVDRRVRPAGERSWPASVFASSS
jgi:glycosyltransferase involved in cell wall biosynthesis